MFNYLDTQTIMVIGLAVVAGAFFVGSIMNGIMEHMSFGTIGNMAILIAGAYLGFYAGSNFMIFGYGAANLAIAGVCGGFLALAALTMIKIALSKFGF